MCQNAPGDTGELVGERDQPEALLHHVQQRLIRLMQTDPDEATVACVNLARLVQIDVRDPASGAQFLAIETRCAPISDRSSKSMGTHCSS